MKVDLSGRASHLYSGTFISNPGVIHTIMATNGVVFLKYSR